MSFQVLGFALFFPICALVYFLLPDLKDNLLKNIWLLAASYFFYMFNNPLYAIFLLYITVLSYFLGLLLTKKDKLKNNTLFTVIIVFLILIPLLIFKYSNFAIRNVNIFAGKIGFPTFSELNLALPVGISFFTFAALGFVLDIKRGKLQAMPNFLHHMLFISFFPTIMAGPIERSGHLVPQFKEKHRFDAERVKNGFLLMLWGYFLKLVLSDRIAIFVNKVFTDGSYSGVYSILAILFYSLQIYFDFASYSYMALGVGEILGFSLISNFERPYLADSIANFWRRWHISLTSFFRDYLYIPLGGNRKGRLRKYINILIVFAVSGLWHGASWNFVFWGLLNGLFQVIGELSSSVRNKIGVILGFNKKTFSYRFLRTSLTFILASIAWTFFRAESFISAIKMLKNCIYFNPWVIFDGSMLKLGLKAFDICIILLSILLVLCVSLMNEKGITIRQKINKQDLWFRWLFYITSIMTVLLLGMYGPSYNSSDFIYFNF